MQAGFHRESRRHRYDAVVVGAGIGGLTAAALLARCGRSVLVIERHDRPGGYLHGFRRRGIQCDAGVHTVGGCAASGPPHRRVLGMLVESLGLEGRVRFLAVDPVAHMVFPDGRIALPQGLTALRESLGERFPAHRQGLEAFLDLAAALADQACRAAAGQGQDFPLLARFRQATLAQVMADHFSDPRLMAVLAGLWPYLGLPPERLSFLYWALMFMGYVRDGAGYCQGSFQRLADALAGCIEAAGGELLYRTGVRRIVLADGRAAGVMTETGQDIKADVVIANADLRHTMEHLVAADRVPSRYLQRLRRMQPSLSAFVTYLGVDSPPPATAAHEVFFYPGWDHERAFDATCRGTPDWFSVTCPTHTDPGLSRDGGHLLMLTTLAPYRLAEDWRVLKSRFQQRLLARAEAWLPGLGARIRWVESGTPRTMMRYTFNHQGAAYGWAASPRQVGPGRPAVETPLPGLYLAGHWATPGGGVYGAALSGVMAAQAVLGIPEQEMLWRRVSGGAGG
ncbi:prolycopene isomerase [Methylomarinovum tepidoasis]|uniref:Prolycopene isomerase n=1 Tax=Methylomarinovum tepidoasis TaxID=2840183 RepID=A0AAU9CYT8_9GAMM|nr:NAD(P)/FAD-dependent oxidoreductase [Methylomarinovum sp. IN45]BCX89875.1 prolycopene isomerase [Methylomarinovum sp. IN45]